MVRGFCRVTAMRSPGGVVSVVNVFNCQLENRTPMRYRLRTLIDGQTPQLAALVAVLFHLRRDLDSKQRGSNAVEPAIPLRLLTSCQA